MAIRQSQQDRKLMMLNEPIYRIIPKMAIPTIIAFLINSIYSLADTYFVSSLGTNAMVWNAECVVAVASALLRAAVTFWGKSSLYRGENHASDATCS